MTIQTIKSIKKEIPLTIAYDSSMPYNYQNYSKKNTLPMNPKNAKTPEKNADNDLIKDILEMRSDIEFS